jgi:hypothetical protein
MSPVPQLFAAVRGRLMAEPLLQEALERRIYFNLPEKPTYPCVVFGVDDIIDHDDTCRIAFNLQLLSAHQKGAEPLKIAHVIDVALAEGMALDVATKANCRKTSMTIDVNKHVVKQFYQAMIWRYQHD